MRPVIKYENRDVLNNDLSKPYKFKQSVNLSQLNSIVDINEDSSNLQILLLDKI